jgi:hypothetical protein
MGVRLPIAGSLLCVLALVTGAQVIGWHFHDCIVCVGIQSPEQRKDPYEGGCKELPESLLTRVFENASLVKKSAPFFAFQLVSHIQPAASEAPNFTQHDDIFVQSAQLCFAECRDFAIFPIPPPQA